MLVVPLGPEFGTRLTGDVTKVVEDDPRVEVPVAITVHAAFTSQSSLTVEVVLFE